MRSLGVVILVIFILALPPVAANGDHATGEEHETERETETREVSVETADDAVEIESKQENTSTSVENTFEIEFEAEEQVEIKLTFAEGLEINETEQETELSYAVESEALVEFRDENGNQLYDEGESVSQYSLEDASFEQINYTTQETANGVTEHVITAASTDNVFTITLHAVGEFAELDTTTVDPTEVKIDLAINNYPYEADDTQVALIAKLKTEKEVEHEEDGREIEREEGVTVPAGDVTGFFSWQPTATVDGSTERVTADLRPRNETGEQTIVLSYPRGDTIVHDPRIGIRFDTPTRTDAILYAALLAVAAIIAVSIWRYR